MEINVFEATVKEQCINVNILHNIIEDTNNVYKCRFIFDEEWDGFYKAAIFQNNDFCAFAFLDKNGECVINKEVIKSGRMCIGVQGVKGERVITTKKCDGVYIQKSGGTIELAPEQITETEYEKLMNQLLDNRIFIEQQTTTAINAVEAANKIIERADAAAERADAAAEIFNVEDICDGKTLCVENGALAWIENFVELTQQEYNSLEYPKEYVLYLIKG